MLTTPQPSRSWCSPRVLLRRLLVVPAAALLLLGIPVLAVAQTAPPPATTVEVPVAPDQAVEAGWTSAPTPVDANLLGVTWDGDPAAEFTVEVQASDGTWSSATGVESDVDGQAEEGSKDAVKAALDPRIASEPVWVGDDAQAVRVSLTSGTATDVAVAAVDAPSAPAPDGSAGALAEFVPSIDGAGRYVFAGALLATALLVGLVAFGWSPWRSRRVRRVAPLVVVALVLAACVPVAPPKPVTNGSTMPGIYTRDIWGARPFACAGGPEYAPQLKFGVVHHTVNSNSYSAQSVASMIRGIQAYHMDANGYCDIAYHFIVDKYGGIWEARAGGMSLPVIGGHSGGFNTGSTSVALLGDYSNIQPPAGQWNAMVHLLQWRLSVGGVHPNAPFTTTVASSPCNCQRWAPGTTVTIPVSLVGHRDLDYTACPGAVWNQLGQLRDQVAAGWVAPTTTTTL